MSNDAIFFLPKLSSHIITVVLSLALSLLPVATVNAQDIITGAFEEIGADSLTGKSVIEKRLPASTANTGTIKLDPEAKQARPSPARPAQEQNAASQTLSKQNQNDSSRVVRISAGQEQTIRGVIVKRDPDSFILRDPTDREILVKWDGQTKYSATSNIALLFRELGITRSLVRGAQVEVEGRGDGSGALLAYWIRFININWISGVIVSCESDRIVLRVTGKDIVVKVTGETKITEKKANPFRRARNYPFTALLRGMEVIVEGRGDSSGVLIAEKIKFTNDDFGVARSLESRVAPVETRVTTTERPPPDDLTPPTIVITSAMMQRGIGVKQSASKITITGQALDESGIREVTVGGEGVRVYGRGNFSAEVPLKVGDNPVTVTATDNHGNRATESFTIRRESEPPSVTGRYFALVIGNNHYPNLPPESRLKTAINDAQVVANLLEVNYGFKIKLLTDAKRSEIIKSLYEYRNSLRPDDHLLVYYAGHGYFDRGTEKAYWMPTDAETDNNANWIIADDVTTNVKAIPARHILIVSDSCFSGAMTRAPVGRLSDRAERERYLEKMRGGVARILMASGGAEPVVDGGGRGHSVFAQALLDGLRGMRERVFTAEELFHEYIKERVAGKSDQTPEYNPVRNSGHESGDFVFVRREPASASKQMKAASTDIQATNDLISQIGNYEARKNIAVYFKVNSMEFSAEAKAALDEIVTQAKNEKVYLIQVTAYVSVDGDKTFNMLISSGRAEFVIRYLSKNHNIPFHRMITPFGYVELEPAADNITREGRQEKGVEVKILVKK